MGTNIYTCEGSESLDTGKCLQLINTLRIYTVVKIRFSSGIIFLEYFQEEVNDKRPRVHEIQTSNGSSLIQKSNNVVLKYF